LAERCASIEYDIGAHYPPSDPQWRGATSHHFLGCVIEVCRARKLKTAAAASGATRRCKSAPEALRMLRQLAENDP